jgi:hypothetical protein
MVVDLLANRAPTMRRMAMGLKIVGIHDSILIFFKKKNANINFLCGHCLQQQKAYKLFTTKKLS